MRKGPVGCDGDVDLDPQVSESEVLTVGREPSSPAVWLDGPKGRTDHMIYIRGGVSMYPRREIEISSTYGFRCFIAVLEGRGREKICSVQCEFWVEVRERSSTERHQESTHVVLYNCQRHQILADQSACFWCGRSYRPCKCTHSSASGAGAPTNPSLLAQCDDSRAEHLKRIQVEAW